MRSDTRSKMLFGAVDLLSRRGVHATSFREVVRHTDTPRGSIAHHFPGGKQQLVEEAVAFAGKMIARPLEHLTAELGVVGGLRAFVAGWRAKLEAERYAAGCPVLAVAIEQFTADARDAQSEADAQAQERLLDIADGVFADWQQILAAALKREGVSPARARRLAALAVSSIEGTVAMCRAARNPQALDDVGQELEAVLATAIGERAA